MEENSKNTKCYNSWSCILSVVIILFIIGSIVYDITISKPQMQSDIKEIREDVKTLNEKIDQQTLYVVELDTLKPLKTSK